MREQRMVGQFYSFTLGGSALLSWWVILEKSLEQGEETGHVVASRGPSRQREQQVSVSQETVVGAAWRVMRPDNGPGDGGLSQGSPRPPPGSGILRRTDGLHPHSYSWMWFITLTDPKQGRQRKKVRGVKSGKPAAASRVPSPVEPHGTPCIPPAVCCDKARELLTPRETHSRHRAFTEDWPWGTLCPSGTHNPDSQKESMCSA